MCRELLKALRFARLKTSLYRLALLGVCGCAQAPSEELSPPPPDFCGAERPPERCALPWLPYIDQVPLGGRFTVAQPMDLSVRVGLSRERSAREPGLWSEDPTVSFNELGFVKVFAQVTSAGPCEGLTHSHSYEVTDVFDLSVTQAVAMDDPRLLGWAEGLESIEYGANVSPIFQTPDKALGPASGGGRDVVSLGQGGEVVLYFEPPIANGRGADFAVFENSFNDHFLELAKVSVSSDGLHYTALPHAYLGEELISAFEEHDPELIFGLAGQHKAGYGTPFDLSSLAWTPDAQLGLLDLHEVRYVKLTDLVGDGGTLDSFQRPIYDPFPTQESAGFDLDAVGVLHTSETDPCPSL